MSERTTVHDTLAVARMYNVPVERVFAAFADAKQRVCWDAPEEGWELGEMGTRLIVTKQSAYFCMETGPRRRGAWVSILDKLARRFAEEQTT